MSIMDEVRMHTCDFDGARIVVLQGTLEARSYKSQGLNHVIKLPKPCTPRHEEAFVAAGLTPSFFHLLVVRESHARGIGGELFWDDSQWHGNDQMSLSGVMYVAAEEAMQYNLYSDELSANRKMIVLMDFQRSVQMKCVNLERGWCEAFDTDGGGSICFTEFEPGCRHVGYAGDLTRVWGILDEDRSGEITIDEFTKEPADLETAPLSPRPRPRGNTNLLARYSTKTKTHVAQEAATVAC
jgi:hypothetical protein